MIVIYTQDETFIRNDEDAAKNVLLTVYGEKLDGEGFSSDPLVVSDALEAVCAGQATVLVDDEVYFITVSEP